MKNKTFIQKIKCAISGLMAAVKTESSFWYYFFILLTTCIVNFVLQCPVYFYLVNFICAFGVFSAECFNTVAEKICDLLISEYNEKIKLIKDIAAGGVLCWGIAYFLAEFIMIGLWLYG